MPRESSGVEVEGFIIHRQAQRRRERRIDGVLVALQRRSTPPPSQLREAGLRVVQAQSFELAVVEEAEAVRRIGGARKGYFERIARAARHKNGSQTTP